MFKLNKIFAVTLAFISLFISFKCGYAQQQQQAVQEDPLRKGAVLVRQGKFNEAIAEFNKVLASDPKSANAYYNIGFAYDKKGDWKKAIENFGKSIELDPSNTDAYYNRAFAYYKKGDLNNAIADYSKVIEKTPNSADAHYGLGLVYYKKNDLDKAVAEYTAAIKARPDFALAYDARAVVYVTKKNYLGAMSNVNKAQSLGYRTRPPKRARGKNVVIANQPLELPDIAPVRSKELPSGLFIVIGVIFSLVAALHLLRMVFRVKITVGKFNVPLWVSALGFFIPFCLALWIFGLLK